MGKLISIRLKSGLVPDQCIITKRAPVGAKSVNAVSQYCRIILLLCSQTQLSTTFTKIDKKNRLKFHHEIIDNLFLSTIFIAVQLWSEMQKTPDMAMCYSVRTSKALLILLYHAQTLCPSDRNMNHEHYAVRSTLLPLLHMTKHLRIFILQNISLF